MCQGTAEPLRAKLRPTNRSWIGFVDVYRPVKSSKSGAVPARPSSAAAAASSSATVTCRRGAGVPGPRSWTPPLCDSRHVGEETPRCRAVWWTRAPNGLHFLKGEAALDGKVLEGQQSSTDLCLHRIIDIFRVKFKFTLDVRPSVMRLETFRQM